MKQTIVGIQVILLDMPMTDNEAWIFQTLLKESLSLTRPVKIQTSSLLLETSKAIALKFLDTKALVNNKMFEVLGLHKDSSFEDIKPVFFFNATGGDSPKENGMYSAAFTFSSQVCNEDMFVVDRVW